MNTETWPAMSYLVIDITWIKRKVLEEDYFFSRHGDHERQNDNLSVWEVENALKNGRILEQYEDTGRGQSCLVAGFTNFGRPIHIVCGRSNDTMTVITVYVPAPPKFKNPYERG